MAIMANRIRQIDRPRGMGLRPEEHIDGSSFGMLYRRIGWKRLAFHAGSNGMRELSERTADTSLVATRKEVLCTGGTALALRLIIVASRPRTSRHTASGGQTVRLERSLNKHRLA